MVNTKRVSVYQILSNYVKLILVQTRSFRAIERFFPAHDKIRRFLCSILEQLFMNYDRFFPFNYDVLTYDNFFHSRL